jgi:lipopolysaccharide/colanic/teichoic acid biosynthesis glycosyltransferase
VTLKRAVDVILSTIGAVFLVLLWLLVALAIKLDSPGPVLHRAVRVGMNGERFVLYKFRTMAADAVSTGPGITRRGDPRITRLGRLLRSLKLDETPQLINVIRGDMSLVGPRPEDPQYVLGYSPEQRRVLTVRPGLCSLATVKYRHEEALLANSDDPENTYVHVVLPDKLRMDLEYIDHRSLPGDLGIMIRSLLSILGRSPQ